MERKMFMEASYLIFEQAKSLRHNSTNAETKLWSYLRTKPMGYKFRRQHPVNTFILDFYCHSLRLAIEVDGNIHMEKNIAQYDKDRQEYLESQGLIFLRFTNRQVEEELAFVIEKIERYIVERTALDNKGE